MTDRRNYWDSLTTQAEFNYLAKDLNPTWDPYTKRYKEHTIIQQEALDLIENKVSCIDFGMGLGRNLDYLKTLFSTVIGYDTKAMVDRFKQYRSDSVTFSWDEAIALKPDLVYECTVFQHMDISDLTNKLQTISKSSTYLYSRTRVYNDVYRDFANGTGGLNIYQYIKDTTTLTPVWCSISLDDAEHLMDETHYDILYRS